MQVRILFFGALAELTGRRAHSLDLPQHSTLADLVARCAREFPGLEKFRESLALSINQNYSPPSAVLHENDEVALLPPVSGGAASTERAAETNVRLVREPIAVAATVAALRCTEDGAVAVFEGVVRNHSRGRRTRYLEYEAYEPMALSQMRGLAESARGSFEIREVVIIHRLGRLEIGETSVLVAVASAHRDAAFAACRWLIDTLKQTVPIWKKEFFADGAVWAPGEPFPPELK